MGPEILATYWLDKKGNGISLNQKNMKKTKKQKKQKNLYLIIILQLKFHIRKKNSLIVFLFCATSDFYFPTNTGDPCCEKTILQPFHLINQMHNQTLSKPTYLILWEVFPWPVTYVTYLQACLKKCYNGSIMAFSSWQGSGIWALNKKAWRQLIS